MNAENGAGDRADPNGQENPAGDDIQSQLNHMNAKIQLLQAQPNNAHQVISSMQGQPLSPRAGSSATNAAWKSKEFW